MTHHHIDMTGQRFSRLVAVECMGYRKWNGTYWRCKCDCGGETTTQRTALVQGRTRSCGCLRREVSSRKRGPRVVEAVTV